MKKLFLAVAAVAMVFATSCKKENVNEPEVPAGDNEFICVIDQNANPQNAPMVEDGMGTMAHIDANNNVWWQVGDEIAYYGQQVINGTAQTATYHTLTCSATSENKAYFSDPNKHFGQGAHKAYYPASLIQYDKVATTQKITVLPSEINLEANKNAGFLPMYASNSGQHYLTFNNICAVLKIKIPASISNCNKIVVSVGGSKYISGPFTMSGTIAVLETSRYASTNFSQTITVNAPSSSNFAADSYVYVAIPDGTYDGFTVTLYNGNDNLNSPTAKNNISVAAGNIYPVTITPTSTKILADAFYFEAATTCTITLKNYNSTTSPTLQYAREGDLDWHKDSIYAVNKQIRVAKGKKLYVRQTSNNTALASSTSNYYRFEITDGTANIGGKLMYLMNANASETTAIDNYAFTKLFYDQDNLKDISNLVFPATISQYCFQSTFENCDNLTSTKIELNATQGQIGCYQNMFMDCKKLVADTLTIGLTSFSSTKICYSMFEGCSKLAPSSSITLHATSCTAHCYRNMFKDCTDLNCSVTINVSSISGSSCLISMFQNCSKLSSVSLPNCTSFDGGKMNNWLNGAGTVQSVKTIHVKNSTVADWFETNSTYKYGWSVSYPQQ